MKKGLEVDYNLEKCFLWSLATMFFASAASATLVLTTTATALTAALSA